MPQGYATARLALLLFPIATLQNYYDLYSLWECAELRDSKAQTNTKDMARIPEGKEFPAPLSPYTPLCVWHNRRRRIGRKTFAATK